MRSRISRPIRRSWPIGPGDLPAKRALRVGLVWAGQARPWLPGFVGLDQRRSTGLATLAPLAAVSGVQFVSLQKGPAAADARTPGAFDLLDVMDEVRDFADTAAIIANLDLVISVDTSVVHLAGAMGKPVFLLDRYDHCWRWLSGREDSPWYPSLRIFRQTRPGEWAPVVARVAEALTRRVANRASCRKSSASHDCRLIPKTAMARSPPQNGEGGPRRMAATNSRHTNEPTAAARKPSM